MGLETPGHLQRAWVVPIRGSLIAGSRDFLNGPSFSSLQDGVCCDSWVCVLVDWVISLQVDTNEDRQAA